MRFKWVVIAQGRVGWVFPIVWNEQTSAPTPANLPWGVREREIVRESSRGSGVFWRIQVSLKPKMLSVDCKEKAEMKSALLTADWQFQRPTEKERGVVEDVAIGRRLAGLRCHLRVFLERGWERTGMVSKHMIEDREGECVREVRNDT